MFPLRKILLPLLFLLACSSVFGHSAMNNFTATISLNHSVCSNDFSRASLEKKGELLLSFAHTVYVSQQHASTKLLSGSAAMHVLPKPDKLKGGLFSFTRQSVYRYPSHFLLIFPFHYFW
ncbi:MAG: hypothetical protein V4450_13825 [Bacteroidota bacterium]